MTISREQLELNAARLNLERAISQLGFAVHPRGWKEYREGDGVDGVALAERVEKHRDGINTALSNWAQALGYYREKKAALLLARQEDS